MGTPELITSVASSMTAFSTQPPDTDPSKVPVALIARRLPTGRGEEPQVWSTKASACARSDQEAIRSSVIRSSVNDKVRMGLASGVDY